jgi:excisionase family DNA binding protein
MERVYENLDLISVAEAAERLHVGRGTIYMLLKDEKNGLKGFRINRTWKIPSASVEEFILRRSSLVQEHSKHAVM